MATKVELNDARCFRCGWLVAEGRSIPAFLDDAPIAPDAAERGRCVIACVSYRVVIVTPRTVAEGAGHTLTLARPSGPRPSRQVVARRARRVLGPHATVETYRPANPEQPSRALVVRIDSSGPLADIVDRTDRIFSVAVESAEEGYARALAWLSEVDSAQHERRKKIAKERAVLKSMREAAILALRAGPNTHEWVGALRSVGAIPPLAIGRSVADDLNRALSGSSRTEVSS